MLLSYVGLREDAKLESKIANNQISDQHLITIKTALNLPYYNNSPQFENFTGSIEVNGVEYEYVKRRVYNDSLELKCYPNLSKTFVKNAKNELFKLSTETPLSSKSKKSAPIKNLLPDYCEDVSLKMNHSNCADKNSFNLFQQHAFLSLSLSVNEQPPESI